MPDRPTEILPVSPETCTVLGYRCKATDPRWVGLDLARAEIRTQASIMVWAVGAAEAPYDLHLRTPWCHPADQPAGWADGMMYRVRPRMKAGRRWQGRKVVVVEFRRDSPADPWVIAVRYG